MRRLPELPRGFTSEFLTTILLDHGALPEGGRVATVRSAPIGEGTGMMAELAKLTVTYEGNRGDAPRTFVAKYASQNETNRRIALSYNLYERETRFVSELGPKTSVRIPRTYYSGRDDDRFLILMEDMTDYQVGSQVEGATLRQTELAIAELAKLHSAFWNRADELDWIPHIADSYHADNMRALANQGFDTVMQRFGDFVPDHLPTRREVFLGAVTELQRRMDTPPVTLCHGDFRMENLLYGCRPGHDPVAVLDWQGPLRARGMNDVALFLGQSTRTDVRRKHERDLLDGYLAGLKAGGVTGLTRDAIWHAYRQTILYNWVYVSVVAGTLDASNERAYAWMSQMVARQSEASDDLEVFQLLP